MLQKSIKKRSLEHPLSQKDDFWSILGSRMASILGLQIDKLGLIIATCCPQGSRRHPGTLRGRILTLPGDLFESPGGHFGTSWDSMGRFCEAWESFSTILGSCWEPHGSKLLQTAETRSKQQQKPATDSKYQQLAATGSSATETCN